jgi:oxygen-independent coproporphyrinogen-3 oxidase
LSKAQSLYFHFPFCETRCHYCDFYSIALARKKPDDAFRLEKAIIKEIHLKQDQMASEIKTLFCGGGTPSLTAVDSYQRILQALDQVTVRANAEFTLEANPGSVTREQLKMLRACGVNRISLGVQSLNQEELLLLGRNHSVNAVFEALEAIFDSGIKNVSVDVLCGVPGQTLFSLEKTLQGLTRYPITHLSCYILTLAAHHPMKKQLPEEDVQLEHFLFVHQFLSDLGFEHYEVSNFAKPSFRCQHNMNYWSQTSYLGLGPSSHSYDVVEQTRSKNVSSLHRYCHQLELGILPVEGLEKLTVDQQQLEKWMLNLRLSDGFSADWLISDAQKKQAQKLIEAEYLRVHPENSDRFSLTPTGFALMDWIVLQLSCA